MKGGSLALKQAREKELAAWIDADAARRKKYGDVLPALRALQAESEKTRERNAAMMTLGSASTYLSAAQTIYRLSVERPKPDMEREAGFQDRDLPRLRDGQDRVQRTIDPTADRALLRWALGLVAGLPAGQRLAAVDQAAGLRAGMSKADAEQAIGRFLGGCMRARGWPTASSASG